MIPSVNLDPIEVITRIAQNQSIVDTVAPVASLDGAPVDADGVQSGREHVRANRSQGHSVEVSQSIDEIRNERFRSRKTTGSRTKRVHQVRRLPASTAQRLPKKREVDTSILCAAIKRMHLHDGGHEGSQSILSRPRVDSSLNPIYPKRSREKVSDRASVSKRCIRDEEAPTASVSKTATPASKSSAVEKRPEERLSSVVAPTAQQNHRRTRPEDMQEPDADARPIMKRCRSLASSELDNEIKTAMRNIGMCRA